MRYDPDDRVHAMAGAFGNAFAVEAARCVTYYGTVVEHNPTGGWNVRYDASGEVYKTPEKFLSLVPDDEGDSKKKRGLSSSKKRGRSSSKKKRRRSSKNRYGSAD